MFQFCTIPYNIHFIRFESGQSGLIDESRFSEELVDESMLVDESVLVDGSELVA